jgi:Alkylmercury lyase
VDLLLVSVPDCPHVDLLAGRVAEVIAGRTDVVVRRRVVSTLAEARALGMAGSPTLLIDGTDPFTEPDQRASVSCRIYREPGQPAQGAPSMAALRRVLDPGWCTHGTAERSDLAGQGATACCAQDAACCLPPPEGWARGALRGSRAAARTTPVAGGLRAVHQAILRGFAANGRPPTPAELDPVATPYGTSAAAVLVALERHDCVGLDAAGEIVVAYPFSAVPTRHRVELGSGMRVWSMCAIDALGMSLMLDTDLVIRSSDPASGEPITVTFHHGQATWEPATGVVFVTQGRAAGPASATCCEHLNFFTDHASAHAWTRAHPDLPGQILDRSQAEQLGRDIFGGLLASTP